MRTMTENKRTTAFIDGNGIEKFYNNLNIFHLRMKT